MATGVVLFDTGRRHLRQKKRRSREQETTNDGQRRFHVITVASGNASRHRIINLLRSTFGVLFIGLTDFLDVFGRVFVEILFTASTAKFDLLPLIYKNQRLAHFAQFVAGDWTCRQQIRLGLGGGGTYGIRAISATSERNNHKCRR